MDILGFRAKLPATFLNCRWPYIREHGDHLERSMAARRLRFNAFMRPASIHTGAWRYPGAWPDMNFNFAHIKECIRKLEAAKFDAYFMADHMAVLNLLMVALKRSHTNTSFEPFKLLSALSKAN
jgi:alkanesulfonate monooxygenase